MSLLPDSMPLPSGSGLESLKAENQQLRASLQSLLEQAHDNHQILQRHHNLNLKLIGADGLPELLHLIFHDLKV